MGQSTQVLTFGIWRSLAGAASGGCGQSDGVHRNEDTRMQRWRGMLLGGALLGVGYALGVSGMGWRALSAQDVEISVSDETANKIRTANRALKDAMDALQSEGRYQSVNGGINAFLILSGGGNALEDLQSGRGVDPETFAALQAGQASPEIQELLGRDERGNLTYSNEVVRLYSRSRLQQKYAERIKITEVGF